MTFLLTGKPSASNGREPSAPGIIPSSITVTSSEAIWLPSLPIRNEAPLYKEYPEIAEDRLLSREAAISGSNTIGHSQVLTFLAPSRLNTRRAAFSPTLVGDSRRVNLRFDEYQ